MSLPLSRERMLERMLAADPAYDGHFITGVISTGIYCLPSCRARKPKPENVVFHDSPRSARCAGLRPCLRCRPDDFYAGIHAEEARVEGLAALFRSSPAAIRNVAHLASVAGVSTSKLHELFRLHFHLPPAEWLARHRVAAARRLLLTSPRSVADIAFGVGFESLSAFGEQFRRWSGLTPGAYRRLPQEQVLRLTLPAGYPVAAILRDLGRDPQSLTSRVTGDTYTAALRLPSGPLAVRVEFGSGTATCTPVLPPDQSGVDGAEVDWGALHEILLRRLGLTADPGRFEAHVAPHPDLAPLLAGRRGLRLPLVADLFDGLLWAILGQQITFSLVCTLRRRLVRSAGREVGGGLWVPPSPEAVAALDEPALLALGLTRARAAALLNAARQVAGGRLSLDTLAAGTATRAERTLLGLPGIGPWSAQYVMLRALGFQDCLPLGDAALARELQHFFALDSRPDRQQTAALMGRFAPHRSLATLHFWHRFQTRKEMPHDHHSTAPADPGPDLSEPAPR
ncbi:putative bifunctional transcriptional activator/DNA repair enzyme AlkA [Deinococcus carri]|uniref:DNA-3-methyladenine glycosylase II n=1 Tax=Deinococcus carri TaxID=1211323 RepID=A0ABP9W891_9DEIO